MAVHPMQPIKADSTGAPRFERNAIVRYLLDWASERGCNLNTLAVLPFSRHDHVQFAQLIGYSLSGFAELPYVSDDDVRAAELTRNGTAPDVAREAVAVEELRAIRNSLREPMARLFGVHPDDLGGEA